MTTVTAFLKDDMLCAKQGNACCLNFAGRNTLRGRHTCCSFDDFWNVDTTFVKKKKKKKG